ncbi:hypothetical protein [Kamptonema formosum]|uniref:hypothetical protein n=1 Tax=Kamptonema formosum TaxID=331992 RepID=UPI00034D8ABB|nr:hypothetical protein [Oscillatoria sp. PCC 10802]
MREILLPQKARGLVSVGHFQKTKVWSFGEFCRTIQYHYKPHGWGTGHRQEKVLA